jgi:hypothetical protein
METICQYKQNAREITQTAIIIEKIHNCKDCPIRKIAIKQPQSIFAKLHAWHKNWWPGWTAHQVRAAANEGAADIQVSFQSAHPFQNTNLNHVL